VDDEIIFKTIDTMDGLEHLRGLVLMKQIGECIGCLLHKGKITCQLKGTMRRLVAAGRWGRMNIELSGRQKVKSAGYNFNYFIVGVSPQKFRIVTGVTYLSQALFAVKRFFTEAGGSPKEVKADFATVLMEIIPKQYYTTSQGIRIIVVEPHVHSRNGKVERSIGVLKTLASVMLGDSNLHTSYWFYTIRHASVLANMIFLVKLWKDPEQRISAWEAQYYEKPHADLNFGPFEFLAHLVLQKEHTLARLDPKDDTDRGIGFGVRSIVGV